jgi:HD-GYP domain-containing protein (c-di-GMP phosphodiesterase class II)
MGLSHEDLEKLRYAGLMHDLGKIEVKQEILCKEGSLTADEYHEIQGHAHGTFELLSKFKFKSTLAEVPLIASSHHERYDGNGYPRNLKGENIHLLARILAVADVLDAITSKRHYRTAMSIVDALGIIKRESGGHFDPKCADALFQVNVPAFLKIHLADNLSKVDQIGLLDMEGYTLETVYQACQSDNPTPNELTMIQCFYRYYQGPVPAKLVGKINPGEQLAA